MASELRKHLLIERQRNSCELKLLFLNRARWIILFLAKETFWAGIIKQLFGQLLAQYLIYLARENRYWAQLMLHPITVYYLRKGQFAYDFAQELDFEIHAFLAKIASVFKNININILVSRSRGKVSV